MFSTTLFPPAAVGSMTELEWWIIFHAEFCHWTSRNSRRIENISIGSPVTASTRHVVRLQETCFFTENRGFLDPFSDAHHSCHDWDRAMFFFSFGAFASNFQKQLSDQNYLNRSSHSSLNKSHGQIVKIQWCHKNGIFDPFSARRHSSLEWDRAMIFVFMWSICFKLSETAFGSKLSQP